ncbi:MAG: four helix bundle protein [Opitutaceae bacterium]|nr:four helix bundle protein [Opitutaceae bacterium]
MRRPSEFRRCRSSVENGRRQIKCIRKQDFLSDGSPAAKSATRQIFGVDAGCGREGDAELKRFLTIALGSACELDYYVLFSGELVYLDDSVSRRLGSELMEIRRMLGFFVQRLKA